MTIESSIEAALFGGVRDLWTFAADRKAWPNVKYNPPARESYLQIVLRPNGVERMFMRGDDPHLYIGLLDLTVVSPLNVGPAEATRLAGQVAGEFPADLALYRSGIKVRITSAPKVYEPTKVDASWNVLVSIPYEAFAAIASVANLDFTIPTNSQYILLI